MPQPFRATELGKPPLGDDLGGGGRLAEVGAAVADHDAARFTPEAVRTLAVGRLGAAVAAAVRQGETPAVATLPFERIGEEPHGQERVTEGCTHNPVEAVRDDAHL